MGLIDSIVSAESGGSPTATNPNSSAVGNGQFLASTWLDTLAKHRPDIQGSPDELLAMRNDPKLSQEMTGAYASDNQAILSKNGLPVTPGTTYLAHFAGPQGAVKLLQADPGAMAGDILGPAVVKANPFLAGMTAQGLQAWAAKKMGATAPQPGTNAPASPAGPPTAPVNTIPQQPAPMFPTAAPQASPQEAPQGMFAQMPAEQMLAPPIFYAPRKPIDLSALKAALAARNSNGLV